MSKHVVGSELDGFLGRDQQYVYSGPFVHAEVALGFVSLVETVEPEERFSHQMITHDRRFLLKD